MTRVAILGGGRRGAQICCEWALGGCSVVWIDQDPAAAEQRIEETLRMFARHGLAGPAELERARALLEPREGPPGSEGRLTLVQEALPEDLALKAALLGELAALHPETLLACTGSAVSVTELGDAAGIGERLLCTHYSDPPGLVATVELVGARETPPRLLARVAQLLRAIGKHPIVLGRDVPGLVSERLEMAMLRECLWLVGAGVASAQEIDEIVRHGVARRWSLTGPFQDAALDGPERVRGLADAIFPTLSTADAAPELEQQLAGTGSSPAGANERRQARLAAALRTDRAAEADATR